MRSTRDGSPHCLRRGARLCSARACKPLHAGPRPNQRTIKRSARKARERACACQRQATTAQSAKATGAPTKGRWCIQHTMSLPQVQKRLLVSVSRAFDECILAGRHAFPPSVSIVHSKEGKRFPTPFVLANPSQGCSPRSSPGAGHPIQLDRKRCLCYCSRTALVHQQGVREVPGGNSGSSTHHLPRRWRRHE